MKILKLKYLPVAHILFAFINAHASLPVKQEAEVCTKKSEKNLVPKQIGKIEAYFKQAKDPRPERLVAQACLNGFCTFSAGQVAKVIQWHKLPVTNTPNSLEVLDSMQERCSHLGNVPMEYITQKDHQVLFQATLDKNGELIVRGALCHLTYKYIYNYETKDLYKYNIRRPR